MTVSYKRLATEQQRGVLRRLRVRRDKYLKLLSSKKVKARVLVVGDRPGPGAPTDPNYHHTPFYAINNCSGWLNSLLEINRVPEEQLLWINAYDTKGKPFDKPIDAEQFDLVVALGGNAEKWCKKNGIKYTKVAHPQYHKRFESKKPYPLIEVLTPFAELG